MKELQFSIVVLMAMMCSALVLLLPERVRRDAVINRSRWLMTGALGLIGVQFLVQYLTGLRQMGVTQGVLANLVFFVPASGLMSMTVLNLQRQGRLRRTEWWGWIVVSVLVIVVLAVAVYIDSRPLEQLSVRVKWTEIVLGAVYAAMQVYYSMLQFRELQSMQAAIEDYYDRERKGLVQWMKHAIGVTALMAPLVPIFMFGPNILLIVYGLLIFWGIFMMWFCFVRYFLTGDMKRVLEAERSAEESIPSPLTSDTMAQVGRAVEHWLATGGHLKAGITSPVAADAMGVPRYQLTAWVKASGHTSFTRWITTLRIEEAKLTLKEHPDWSIEAVADHCGFSRTHFQRVFKQEAGCSPADYLKVP
ncbi:MAG: AraC family transcriptional regulator [Prevotella sp.]|nr:AraC family transcriptional regulator [Prevotella sp.]